MSLCQSIALFLLTRKTFVFIREAVSEVMGQADIKTRKGMYVLLLPRPSLLMERDDNFGPDWKKCSCNLGICLPFTDLFDGLFLFSEKVPLNLTWIELSKKIKPFFICQFMWYVAFIFRLNNWLYRAVSTCRPKSPGNVWPRVHTGRRGRGWNYILRGTEKFLRTHGKKKGRKWQCLSWFHVKGFN